MQKFNLLIFIIFLFSFSFVLADTYTSGDSFTTTKITYLVPSDGIECDDIVNIGSILNITGGTYEHYYDLDDNYDNFTTLTICDGDNDCGEDNCTVDRICDTIIVEEEEPTFFSSSGVFPNPLVGLDEKITEFSKIISENTIFNDKTIKIMIYLFIAVFVLLFIILCLMIYIIIKNRKRN